MHLTFTYNPQLEFENFRASFGSMNHTEPSPRQQQFFSRFSELTRENAAVFATDYLREHHLDPETTVRDIEARWRVVEAEFFRRANAIVGQPLPLKQVAVYLTIHDRCSYNFQRGYFFVHTNLPAVTKTIMHELWHFYYFSTFGDTVTQQYGRQASNTLKESLTVLLNSAFADLMPGVTDRGYPQHAALREHITQVYNETHSFSETVHRSLQLLV